MNLIELNRALPQLRLGGIAAVLETRLLQAQAGTHDTNRFSLLSGVRRTDSSRRSDCWNDAGNKHSFASRK